MTRGFTAYRSALVLASMVLLARSPDAQSVGSDTVLHLRQVAHTLPQLSAGEQASVLDDLRKLGPRAAFSTQSLLQIWQRATGATDDKLLAATLDVFRAMRNAGQPAAPELAQYLGHESAVYWDRDQLEVIRLRSYLMVTLGDIGLPVAAYPHLLDSLAHIDERVFALEVGSAARAVRSAQGASRKRFIRHLLQIVPKAFAEEEFSLARYSVDFPDHEVTTCQLEAIDTLAVLCGPDDQRAIDLLERLSELPKDSRWDRRAIDAAKRALKSIRSRKSSSFATQLRIR